MSAAEGGLQEAVGHDQKNVSASPISVYAMRSGDRRVQVRRGQAPEQRAQQSRSTARRDDREREPVVNAGIGLLNAQRPAAAQQQCERRW